MLRSDKAAFCSLKKKRINVTSNEVTDRAEKGAREKKTKGEREGERGGEQQRQKQSAKKTTIAVRRSLASLVADLWISSGCYGLGDNTRCYMQLSNWPGVHSTTKMNRVCERSRGEQPVVGCVCGSADGANGFGDDCRLGE